MVTAHHDSTPSLYPISLDSSAELDPQELRPPEALPVFDLQSDAPLPKLPDEPNLPPFPTPAAGTPSWGRSIESAPATKDASGTPSSGTPAKSIESPAVISSESTDLEMRGDVLMCGCPDCKAPIAIRTWLMVADCWRCNISIELSEEQEREAERLIKKREDMQRKAARAPAQKQAPTSAPKPPPPPKATAPTKAAVAAASATATAAPPRPGSMAETTELPRNKLGPELKTSHSRAPRPRQARPKTAASNKPMVGARARIRKLAKHGGTTLVVSDLFRDTPAWLISLVFHLVLVTLLGLMSLDFSDESELITLSMAVNAVDEDGGDTVAIAKNEEASFDLPIPEDTDLSNPDDLEAMVRADQDARELRIAETADPALPSVARVKAMVSKSGEIRATLAARDPRLRVEVVKQEGGTTLTEAAVARGLRWISEQQNSDGSWDLKGGIKSKTAGTSLALLPFLGAGQTHLVGRYQNHVAKGIQWLVANQKPNGDLRAGTSGTPGMYSHGQAAIVLCEAFLMTGDEELRVPAQTAIDFISEAQYADGGWRYEPRSKVGPNTKGDTSVAGWQIMALQSARAANLTVDPSVLELANHFLDRVQKEDGALYCYQEGKSPTHVMTAEGLLCRIYMGWKKDNPALEPGVKHLIENHLPSSRRDFNMYYFYYGTQLMHHYGGEPWEKWNQRMRDILVEHQRRDGKNAGSWQSSSGHGRAGGPLYTTALAVCTLEVYYRHLPIFRQIDVD